MYTFIRLYIFTISIEFSQFILAFFTAAHPSTFLLWSTSSPHPSVNGRHKKMLPGIMDILIENFLYLKMSSLIIIGPGGGGGDFSAYFYVFLKKCYFWRRFKLRKMALCKKHQENLPKTSGKIHQKRAAHIRFPMFFKLVSP